MTTNSSTTGTVKRSKRLATKLSAFIAISLFIVFTVLILFMADIIGKDLIEREQYKLSLLAKENATVAQDIMDKMIYKQEVLRSSIINMRNIDSEDKLQIIQNLLTETKKTESGILSLFVVAEPNAFMPNTPDGYSIYVTDKDIVTDDNMYASINKDLYNVVRESTSTAVIDPFEKEIDGKKYTVITVLLPMISADGKITGTLGCNINVATLNNAEYNDGGYTSFVNQIVCGHKTVIVHSNHQENIGKAFLDVDKSKNAQQIVDSASDASTLNILDVNSDGEKRYKSFAPFYLEGSKVAWLSGTSISQSEFSQTIVMQLLNVAIVLIIALVLLTILIYMYITKILKPIAKIDRAARELSMGNLSFEIDYRSEDELGALADSLRASTKTLSSYIADIDRAMEEMSNGNFDLAPSEPFIGDFVNIEKSITRFIVNISTAFASMTDATGQVSSGADMVAQNAQILAGGASEQAASIEELSASMEKVVEQIDSNTSNSDKANQMSMSAASSIESSNGQMKRLMAAMDEINAKSNEIGKIIKTIEDIAFQTNILALNAAVEAARAGAAGKGFAVVADEVRNLANKSSQAAKNTTTLIESSVTAVNNGVSIAHETASDLANVTKGASETTRYINQINEASHEQLRMISGLSSTIQQISDVIQSNSATSQESAATSEELSSQAQVLKQAISRFKIKKL